MTKLSMIATRRGEGGGFAILVGTTWYDITKRVMCAQSKVKPDLIAAANGVLITSDLVAIENPLVSGGAIIAQAMMFDPRAWVSVSPGWADAIAYFSEAE